MARGTGQVQMLPSTARHPCFGGGCTWRQHEQPLGGSRIGFGIKLLGRLVFHFAGWEASDSGQVGVPSDLSLG